MTQINFQQLMQEATTGFEPVPDDQYTVQVEKANADKPTSTGKPMIKVEYRILGGPHDGRKLFDQFVISPENPNALGFFFENLATFGLDANFFSQNPPLELVAQTLVGRQAVVTTGTREWKGRVQNDIQSYAPGNNVAPGGMPHGVPSAPGAQTAPQPPQQPQSPAPQPQAAAQPDPVYGDDEEPF